MNEKKFSIGSRANRSSGAEKKPVESSERSSSASPKTSVSRYGSGKPRPKSNVRSDNNDIIPHDPSVSSAKRKIIKQMERRPQGKIALKRDNRNRAKLSIPGPGNKVRIIPLGGVEEIGMNMNVIEYKNDIIIVDMGFAFRRDTTPGIDYILPNSTYLEERKEKIRGVFITHGHLDHIGGIPYLMDRIGNPPIYARSLTTTMIKKRQEEFPDKPALNLVDVTNTDAVRCGELLIKFFDITHTIPESMGVIIETPIGIITALGDVKLDHVDGEPTAAEKKAYGIFKNKEIMLMISDSTNVERPGWSLPEWKVHENLEQIISGVKGRLIIGTFASQIDRIIKIVNHSEKIGKKIVIEGRSMKTNVEIIKKLNLLNPKPGTFISSDQIDQYPPDKIIVLATGAQGDEFAALMRMSTKQHKQIKLNPRDTILLSSSVIPGNEMAVAGLKDNLARQKVKIIHYMVSDVHASGHGYQEEVSWIHRQIRPKFFIPVHGNHYMLRTHAALAERLGMPSDNIVIPDNGSIIELDGKTIETIKAMAPNEPLLVDGFSVGSMKDVVLRDREALANDGMFVIVASINPKTGRLRKSPDIISRGFVYLRESQELLRKTRTIIKRTIESQTRGQNPIDFDSVKEAVSDNVSKYLLQQTAKRPIIIPVIIGV